MIYPDNFEPKLGFDKIRALLRGATLCGLGARRVDEMAFSADAAWIGRELALLAEMMRVLQEARRPMPTDGFCDVTEALRRVRLEGTYLDTEELFALRRALEAALALVRYFTPREGDDTHGAWPLLRREAEDVPTFPDLLRRIDQTMTPTGEIRDNATPELARIRRELESTLAGIGRLLRSILRQAQGEGIVEAGVTPSVRDGRLVIPVTPANRRKIRGIVHDESATGKTLYVEPAEVVDANNRIRELEGEERQEIIRILQALTAEVRPLLPDILASQDYLGTIDFLRAKARLAERLGAVVPALGDVTDWVEARHPLLYLRYAKEGKAGQVVPLDIRLDGDGQRIVLISGPNAGGKSVCLETLGLVQYMLQCGLAVPMRENSQCAVFDHIMIDIGDEQSIDNDLSTYSSHLQNMKVFLRQANARTLLLIDEFGSGTEPQIGGAIAQAILGKLNEARARGVITTHFTNLKQFADETEGIANGAMLYDRDGMRPLFRLEVGRPGSSFAVEIAQRIGLPRDVIDEARRIVGSDYVNMDKYLQDISRDKRYWEQKRQKIHQQEKELEALAARLEARADELKTKRQELLKGAKDEAATLLREANARIEQTIRGIREAQAEREATRSLRQGLHDFADATLSDADAAGRDAEVDRMKRVGRLSPQQQRALGRAKKASRPAGTPEADAQPTVGATVRLKGQQTVGEVIAVSGRQCVVAFGMLKSTVDMSRLEVVHRTAAHGEARTVAPAATSRTELVHERNLQFRRELDIRGMRADEALQAVAYYIDDAIMLSAGQVRILHGTGTGALRQVVRQYLASVPGVADYHDEHVQFGGAGVTVVELE